MKAKRITVRQRMEIKNELIRKLRGERDLFRDWIIYMRWEWRCDGYGSESADAALAGLSVEAGVGYPDAMKLPLESLARRKEEPIDAGGKAG